MKLKRYIRAFLIRKLFGPVTMIEAAALNSIDPKYNNLICISREGRFSMSKISISGSLTLVGDVTCESADKLSEIFPIRLTAS